MSSEFIIQRSAFSIYHCRSNRYNAPMSKPVSDLVPSPRLLLGPGPSLVHPRVLRAMSTPLLGHLDPEFLTIMNEVQALLRTVFQTENQIGRASCRERV